MQSEKVMTASTWVESEAECDTALFCNAKLVFLPRQYEIK